MEAMLEAAQEGLAPSAAGEVELPRRRGRPPISAFCQVCGVEVSHLGGFFKRYRICRAHSTAPQLEVAGMSQRFCQQCGAFHPLEAFRGDQRSCSEQLAFHAARRRQLRRQRREQLDQQHQEGGRRVRGARYSGSGSGSDDAGTSSCDLGPSAARAGPANATAASFGQSAEQPMQILVHQLSLEPSVTLPGAASAELARQPVPAPLPLLPERQPSLLELSLDPMLPSMDSTHSTTTALCGMFDGASAALTSACAAASQWQQQLQWQREQARAAQQRGAADPSPAPGAGLKRKLSADAAPTKPAADHADSELEGALSLLRTLAPHQAHTQAQPHQPIAKPLKHDNPFSLAALAALAKGAGGRQEVASQLDIQLARLLAAVWGEQGASPSCGPSLEDQMRHVLGLLQPQPVAPTALRPTAVRPWRDQAAQQGYVAMLVQLLQLMQAQQQIKQWQPRGAAAAVPPRGSLGSAFAPFVH